ncbi:hypothetical protein [Streptomyces sp. NPDC048361]|uniref:hypothetical protein n=1 Tax=Streptomyces sp. NPDC048361 TaxID=3154720 RepID=UPI00342BFBFA
MGAKRSHRITRRAALAPAALVPALALAVAGLTACDPVGGLNSAAVALTTDQAATTELEHHHVDIKWLTCNADLNRGASATPSAATTKDVADVNCQGETKDGRAITVKGKVTQEVEGRCVKGDLTAKVAGKTVFRSSVLGNCEAPAPTGPATFHPGGATPTATVTVTVTVTATVTVTESFRGK